MVTGSTFGRVPTRAIHTGDWRPAAHSIALLVIQLVNLWQAWLRGRDYLRTDTGGPTLAVIETSVRGGVDTWGWFLLGAVGLCIIGLAGRWAAPVIAGHALLWGLYTGLGVGVLRTVGVTLDLDTIAGAVLSIAGAWVMFRPDRDPLTLPDNAAAWWAPWRRVPAFTTPVRLLVGVPSMILGQEYLVRGLNDEFRSGTALIAASLVHLTLALATFVLWNRQRLVPVAEDVVRRDRES